jgi:hypothetical protein
MNSVIAIQFGAEWEKCIIILWFTEEHVRRTQKNTEEPCEPPSAAPATEAAIL